MPKKLDKSKRNEDRLLQELEKWSVHVERVCGRDQSQRGQLGKLSSMFPLLSKGQRLAHRHLLLFSGALSEFFNGEPTSLARVLQDRAIVERCAEIELRLLKCSGSLLKLLGHKTTAEPEHKAVFSLIDVRTIVVRSPAIRLSGVLFRLSSERMAHLCRPRSCRLQSGVLFENWCYWPSNLS
jgi:hypothetical protein